MMNQFFMDDGDDFDVPEELAGAVVDARLEPALPPPPSMIAPEADLYGDNALDNEF
jgi:hypothetical protein